jgi:ferredoxin
MDILTLTKEKVPELIQKMVVEYDVFGPKRYNGLTSFEQIADPSEINLEYLNSKMPPKALFFQQTETLFKFTPGVRGTIEGVDSNDKNSVIFGIRPCDANSLAILDRVFDGDYKDEYYLTKRENTVLIGLSCAQPGTNCFCTSFDDGPASADNVDLLLTDIGDKYYVEVGSDKGKKLVKSLEGLFEPATSEDTEKRNEVEERAMSMIKRSVPTDNTADKLDETFDDTLWEKYAVKCLGCGICTYLCPTCHCFDIQDECVLDRGARVRVWDTCMNTEYTLQASGYNPRPTRMNRTRNRIHHKYNYIPRNLDVIACVGCGRCIDNCPVNIDIIDVVTQAIEVKA